MATFKSLYNNRIKEASRLQKQENELANGKFFAKLIEGAEKRLTLDSLPKKSELSDELESAIWDCFGSPQPNIFALNMELVSSTIERINAYNKAKEDALKLIEAQRAEQLAIANKKAEREAKKAEIEAKKAKENELATA